MGMVMIKCPSTGHAVSTGIEMPNMDRLPTVTATMVCSACGRIHEWTRADAWLAEGGEYYRQIDVERAAKQRTNGHRPAALVGTRQD